MHLNQVERERESERGERLKSSHRSTKQRKDNGAVFD